MYNANIAMTLLEKKMSHEIAQIGGRDNFAYVGEKAWHGLGQKMPEGSSPEEMMIAAGANWEIHEFPLAIDLGLDQNGVRVTVPTDKKALGRVDSDGTFHQMLDVVSQRWTPLQNREAFQFFDAFTKTNEMQMESAGVLNDGKTVFALAKINRDYEVVKGDEIKAYFLLTNPHEHGKSIRVEGTDIRVVCKNTLSYAQRVADKANIYRHSHATQFNADAAESFVRETLLGQDAYIEEQKFMASKQYDMENLIQYFSEVFPVAVSSQKETSRNAKRALEYIETQPGAEYAEGTWYSALNAVTYMTDHIIGSERVRQGSALYGPGRTTKQRARSLAMDYANAS